MADCQYYHVGRRCVVLDHSSPRHPGQEQHLCILDIYKKEILLSQLSTVHNEDYNLLY